MDGRPGAHLPVAVRGRGRLAAFRAFRVRGPGGGLLGLGRQRRGGAAARATIWRLRCGLCRDALHWPRGAGRFGALAPRGYAGCGAARVARGARASARGARCARGRARAAAHGRPWRSDSPDLALGLAAAAALGLRLLGGQLPLGGAAACCDARRLHGHFCHKLAFRRIRALGPLFGLSWFPGVHRGVGLRVEPAQPASQDRLRARACEPRRPAAPVARRLLPGFAAGSPAILQLRRVVPQGGAAGDEDLGGHQRVRQ
mmetsp:Transcript_8194/g.24099  ORF Transcript_8194/g.24099 Transcript_8194/m.24099 type:complete len:258 (-) Transcript_8194:741-1514(-)